MSTLGSQAMLAFSPETFFENRIGRLLTVSELAKLLRCSEGTIRNMVYQGRIPTVRPTPRMVRFHVEVIRKWLSERSEPI